MEVTDSLNRSLASNSLFASDAEKAFENARAPFVNSTLSSEDQINIPRPDFVREVRIQNNDILERIAQREYGDASRWVDLVVINNLKPPYISPDGGDGVLKPGQNILVGDR